MTTVEKIELLDEYRDLAVLSDKHFEILKELSFDVDEYVRSQVAYHLYRFVNEDSKNILLKLAKDEDDVVRMEALDSLIIFPFPDVVTFLEEAMLGEEDDIVRRYVIFAWTHVLILLNGVTDEKVKLVEHKRHAEEFSHCALAWCYALFRFGNEGILPELLKFLNDEDYHVRCCTSSFLHDIINPNNEAQIKEAISKLLVIEKSRAVSEHAKCFLREN